MSTYAPIFNPQRDTQLLIYSIAANKHLSLRTFDTTQTNKPTDATNTTGLQDGFITVPSTVTALQFQEWVRVYGWLDVAIPNDPKTTQKSLYMLSPVYEPVFKTISPCTSLTGVSGSADGSNSGYLYYLDSEDNITELNLVTGDTRVIASAAKVKSESVLSASLGWDKKTRYVAFQTNPNNRIQIYNAAKDDALPQAAGTAHAVEKSPIAIVQWLNKENNQNVWNLYYLRKDGLWRSQRTGKGDWVDLALPDAGLPKEDTSLSATWDPKSSAVFLTFSTKDRVTCVKDKW